MYADAAAGAAESCGSLCSPHLLFTHNNLIEIIYLVDYMDILIFAADNSIIMISFTF